MLNPLAQQMLEETLLQTIAGETPLESVLVQAKDGEALLVARPSDFPMILEIDADEGSRTLHADALVQEIGELLPDKGAVVLTTQEREIEVRREGAGVEVTSKELPEDAEAVARAQRWEKPEYPIKANKAKRLLQVLGLATEQGEVKAPLRRKFNQINRLILLIQPMLEKLPRDREVVVLDCGCGKSFLTFLLNFHFRRNLKVKAFFYGIDRDVSLIERCRQMQTDLNYDNMKFERGAIAGFEPERPVDLLISLHACNTATDDALGRAVQLGAPFILSAPCCQQELVGQLAPEACPGLFDEGLLKERLAALMTDSLRCLALRSRGYLVRVAEFVPPWDTPKNVLIRAERVGKSSPEAAHKFHALCEQFGVRPRIGEVVAGD